MATYRIPCKHAGCTAMIEYDPDELPLRGDERGVDSGDVKSNIVYKKCAKGHLNRLTIRAKAGAGIVAPLSALAEENEIDDFELLNG